jgi:tRNA (cytidine/uridine-2'-O-)-methyltransferase
MPMLRIALVHPEIPQNTGNIARLCVVNDLQLHLVHPLGFKIDDRALRRAGMDYWKHLDLVEHADLDAFLAHAKKAGGKMWFLSSHAEQSLWEAGFSSDDWLVFGAESRGLPERLRNLEPEGWITLPMRGSFVRSLNLSSAAAAATYEALRQCTFIQGQP